MGPKESGAAQVVAYIQGKGEKPTVEKVAEAAETIKALADEVAVIWAEAAAAVRNMVATMVRACEMEKALRDELWDGTQWVADYRRIRVIASK